MGSVIKFQPETPPKFGFKRVKKRKRAADLEKHGQLNLFTTPSHEARVIQMPSNLSPFEEALLLDEKGDTKVKESYQKAIDAGDSLADAYCNLGILEFKDGNTVKAIDCFTKSLKFDPRHFESHYNLANLYSDIGDHALAIVHYQLAAEIEPDYSNLYYNLGLVQAMHNELEAAIKSIEHFLALAPEQKSHNAHELLDSLRKSLTVD